MAVSHLLHELQAKSNSKHRIAKSERSNFPTPAGIAKIGCAGDIMTRSTTCTTVLTADFALIQPTSRVPRAEREAGRGHSSLPRALLHWSVPPEPSRRICVCGIVNSGSCCTSSHRLPGPHCSSGPPSLGAPKIPLQDETVRFELLAS